MDVVILRAAYVPLEPTTLYGDNGIEVRGAFGRALLETVCFDKPTCRQRPCAFPASCLYTELFTGNDPSYALQFPVWQRFQPCDAENPLVFLISLYGRAVVHTPLISRVLERMGDYLFTTPGAPSVPSKLTDLTCLSAPGHPDGVSLLQAGKLHAERAVRVRGADILAQPVSGAVDTLGIDFVTPTNFTESRERVTEPTFYQLMKRTLARIRQVAGLPHSYRFDLDLDLAHDVACLGHTLEQVTVKRTSKAQQFEIWLHGFRGRMVFQDVPAAFIPYLSLARLLNVGQKTTHGLGHFRLLL